MIVGEPKFEEIVPPASAYAYAHEMAYRSACSWLRGDADCDKLLDDFEKKAQLRGWGSSDARYQLALRRAIEPLTVHSRTGGIERSIQQLSASKQLQPFLRASLRREFILLAKEQDLPRAQRTTPYVDDFDLEVLSHRWPGLSRPAKKKPHKRAKKRR